MYLKIKIAKLQPNSFGKNDILISQVHALDNEGKYIKAIKLTQELVDRIIDAPMFLKGEDDEVLLE
jgi:hypothetical protein